MRTTSRPASSPASRVAWRWASLKYAGTVMTAFLISVPSSREARSLRTLRIIAEISCGRYSWSPSCTLTSCPILRLIDLMVRSGASTHWLRAALPTSSRPSSARPTNDGRIGSPSSSVQTCGWPLRRIATSLFVVPRSIPTMISITCLLFFPACGFAQGCKAASGRSVRQGQGDQLLLVEQPTHRKDDVLFPVDRVGHRSPCDVVGQIDLRQQRPGLLVEGAQLGIGGHTGGECFENSVIADQPDDLADLALLPDEQQRLRRQDLPPMGRAEALRQSLDTPERRVVPWSLAQRHLPGVFSSIQVDRRQPAVGWLDQRQAARALQLALERA